MKNSPVTSPVLDFYDGAKILVTGCTGFLGKSLVEKLLRVCNASQIYVIIREKKDKDATTRLKETLNDAIFDTLKKTKAEVLNKIVCVKGDMMDKNLGLSDEIYDLFTKEITHVLHVAATVRFKESLKNSLRTNVLGLRELITLCNQCLKLKVFVHTSTAFCYYRGVSLKEELRESPVSPEDVPSYVNFLKQDMPEEFNLELIKPWPNNYAFSKAVAENVANFYTKNYPVVIIRPSIVMGTFKEPVPGWIDNINGPTGILVGCGTGVMRLMWADKDAEANLVPVDMVVNALLCGAYDVAKNYNNDSTLVKNNVENISEPVTKKNLKIFNFVARKENSITWGDFRRINYEEGIKYPSNLILWYYTMTLVKTRTMFYIITFFYHFLPGILLDTILILSGNKPRLVKTYKKIFAFCKALEYYSLYTWQFDDSNTRSLWNSLSETDKKLFDFNMSELDWKMYFINTIKGIRLFIFKLDDSTLPQARRKMFLFWIAHNILKLALAVLFLWVVNKYIFKFGSYDQEPISNVIEPKLM